LAESNLDENFATDEYTDKSYLVRCNRSSVLFSGSSKVCGVFLQDESHRCKMYEETASTESSRRLKCHRSDIKCTSHLFRNTTSEGSIVPEGRQRPASAIALHQRFYGCRKVSWQHGPRATLRHREIRFVPFPAVRRRIERMRLKNPATKLLSIIERDPEVYLEDTREENRSRTRLRVARIKFADRNV